MHLDIAKADFFLRSAQLIPDVFHQQFPRPADTDEAATGMPKRHTHAFGDHNAVTFQGRVRNRRRHVAAQQIFPDKLGHAVVE